ncbi:amino acid permease [Commensalibacter papalotli (ex Servin-Garciduenas et al. 2014)]|uniref:Amino acid permease-associated protein n=1 Tax=Commensalibacter papalotli (ex Servin-Garciduenas et al. 2014) TaxID=1208583 RepID=W7E041_9PROT|nr:amino acid permease [Commensalibacter papalotli (ex Servin-Garciduenas et al. 2014)]EUK18299.1 amino acid permease-associated protein [Commensalibacter papalotli (ex Servin-Garciduenas et al. 2014)]
MTSKKNKEKIISPPLKDGELAHTLERRHVVMISMGGIIGAGLFVGASASIHAAGPAVLLSYIITGLMIFFVMRMLGELVIQRPEIGSFLNHIRRGLGHNVTFVLGWGYWLFWISAIAAESIAGGEMLQHYMHIPKEYSFTATMLLGPILVIAMMLTNLFSVRGYGEFEFWFALIKIVAIAAFIVVGGIAITHLFGFTEGHIENIWTHSGFFPNGLIAILTIIPTVLFTVTGSEVATIAAAESDKPAENVAYATRTIVFRIIAFYVLSIGVILAIVPWDKVVPGVSPFLMALQAIHIPYAADIMEFTILIAILSCLNSSIYATSRTLFELAEYNDAPRWLIHTTSNGVPKRAIITASFIGIAISIASYISPSHTFSYLLSCAGSIILFVYIAIGLSQINVRKKMEKANQLPIFQMWLFPYLSWFTVLSLIAVVIAMLFNSVSRTQIIITCAILGVIGICRVFTYKHSHTGEMKHSELE